MKHNWYWLAYIDGTQLICCAIVSATNPIEAVIEANISNLNPGFGRIEIHEMLHRSTWAQYKLPIYAHITPDDIQALKDQGIPMYDD